VKDAVDGVDGLSMVSGQQQKTLHSGDDHPQWPGSNRGYEAGSPGRFLLIKTGMVIHGFSGLNFF
jgi:hypothetical protein